MSFVNVIPWAQSLTQGASGIGASIYFRLNSAWIASSSTFGIMLGGLMKGMEKEGLTHKGVPLAIPFVANLRGTGWKIEHKRPSDGNGS